MPTPNKTDPDQAPQPRKRGRDKRPAQPANAGILPLTSPVDQEALARWVEQQYAPYHRLVQQEAGWLAQHPDDKDSRGRIAWYRNAVAISKQIAYRIRTSKLMELR